MGKKSAGLKKPAPAEAGVAGPAAEAGPRQFVIFFVGAEAFAIPLSSVKEIIRVPVLVRLPLSPPSLRGLANLRGDVLPIVSARRLFSMPDQADDDATRVIILDHGRPLGVVVDRMANVVTVETSQIEASEGVESAVDSDVLCGMIKDVGDLGMVMILDSARMLEAEFSALDRAVQGRASGGGTVEAPAAAARSEAGDELQLVSFEVADQEYALPIESVQEIVQVPGDITTVPKSGAAVLGVMNLRDRLLPVVSLRALFGLPGGELADHNRVVVVSLDGGASVGVVMDRVKEVLRVPRSVLDPMPALLAEDRNLREIVSICRLDEGQRLVSVLSAEAMFDHSRIKEEAGMSAEETRVQVAGTGAGAATEEEQFVIFRLLEAEYGLAITAVQEIVRVPEQITRVPKTPHFIEGLVNLRGSVIPLVDQRRRFDLPQAEWSDRQRIMVLIIDGVRTGFIVDSVSEVMRIPQSVVGDAPELSEGLQRVVRRVANLSEQSRMILLLEADQMLDTDETRELRAAA